MATTKSILTADDLLVHCGNTVPGFRMEFSLKQQYNNNKTFYYVFKAKTWASFHNGGRGLCSISTAQHDNMVEGRDAVVKTVCERTLKKHEEFLVEELRNNLNKY